VKVRLYRVGKLARILSGPLREPVRVLGPLAGFWPADEATAKADLRWVLSSRRELL
jgi:hypothetical protein